MYVNYPLIYNTTTIIAHACMYMYVRSILHVVRTFISSAVDRSYGSAGRKYIVQGIYIHVHERGWTHWRCRRASQPLAPTPPPPLPHPSPLSKGRGGEGNREDESRASYNSLDV